MCGGEGVLYACVSCAEPGGSWGYDSSSVDAIRFSPSKDVMLAGVGLFGGRTPANYEITVSGHW